MYWYLKVLKNYVGFEGRARRKEYWMFTLFSLIATILIAVIDVIFGTLDAESGWGLFGTLYGLAVFLPGLAVSVRRLHDIDKSGWWLLIMFVPLVGILVLLVFAVREGTNSNNRFGPDPKIGEEGGAPALA
ncbi:DUF805 domain-containing protein [Lysobacter sp. GX 14042]|uniref:DUF805 domain-containing protein n=1 Tax=Lysobacter sp. GX 14042 TaxID=2907155 RepID=UPI001F375979|nr:DUF805 domain-containing protein [Lysobacter sp. GX 14042]MCE7032132.1 DUF805 domain-containing protein [Lysobacter sp. GX 14042]